jgi:hypothetical protein
MESSGEEVVVLTKPHIRQEQGDADFDEKKTDKVELQASPKISENGKINEFNRAKNDNNEIKLVPAESSHHSQRSNGTV